MQLATGTRIGRYQIELPLGAGGMGEVYRARDLQLDRPVALKILPADVLERPDRVRRFVQEAKAACALNHPNVAHVYEVGQGDGLHFISMEYVQGETLRERLTKHPPSAVETVEIVNQVAAALAGAHAAGVVHRDIKPENIMLRPDGYVKVLDFGLAKLLQPSEPDDRGATALKTTPGTVMGTVDYMSPEQLRGDDVDQRSDVFSLGVMLYEMLSGHRPFEAQSKSDRIAAVLTREPDLRDVQEPELRAIVAKALQKDRQQRYRSAAELQQALNQYGRARKTSSDVQTEALQVPRMSKRRFIGIGVAALVVAASAIIWPAAVRAKSRRRALSDVPRLESLVDHGRYFDAFDLGNQLRAVLPGDERVSRAMEKISDRLTVKTTPDGARVFLRRYEPPRVTTSELVGTTPLEKLPVARGDYILTLQKEGYATVSRPLSLAPLHVIDLTVNAPPPVIDQHLQRADEVPRGMVHVQGGPYRLVGWSRPSEALVPLDDFYIDRYEVSNAQFAEFVANGGYRHPEFWKYRFAKDGKTLSFSEAMSLLHDTTGLPAPRGWASQRYPQGQSNYPVSGLTWYEAAAYAEFVHKKLPTVFEWDKAAHNGAVSGFGSSFPWGFVPAGIDIRPRANLEGTGPMPVDSMEFGLSPFGALNMAGNVSEWCRNTYGEGFATRGGAFDDGTYVFGAVGDYPGFYASPKIGFRCVQESQSTTADQGGFALSKAEAAVFKPMPDAEFARLIEPRYNYDKSPLDAKVVAVEETDAWRREKIAFNGVKGRRAIAYLYLPKHAARPLQVIHFVPAIDVARRMRALPDEMEFFLTPFIRAGRAAFGVVLQGYIEREPPPGYVEPTPKEAEFGDAMIDDVTEFRRGLDYLETRPDIDKTRIAYFGPSAGADLGLLVAGVEHRYRALVLEGAGIRRRDAEAVAVANKINFVPHITGQKLLLNGRYDEIHPMHTDAEPLFRLLREPKKFLLYEGGHAPILESTIRITTEFLDRTLGPVTQ